MVPEAMHIWGFATFFCVLLCLHLVSTPIALRLRYFAKINGYTVLSRERIENVK